VVASFTGHRQGAADGLKEENHGLINETRHAFASR